MAIWSQRTGSRGGGGPTDVVGLDIAASGIKAVRLRRHRGQVTVVAAGMVQEAIPGHEHGLHQDNRIRLPRSFHSKYAALAVSHPDAQARVVRFPTLDRRESPLVRIRKAMGLDKDVRLNGLNLGGGRSESVFLAASLPEGVAQTALGYLSHGTPVPISLELSGLACLAAWDRLFGEAHKEEAVAILEGGTSSLTLALVAGGNLVLLRTFNWGGENLIDAVAEALDLDRALAAGLMGDPPVDISDAVSRVTAPLLEQLGMARDLVERRHQSHLVSLYVSGGLCQSLFWTRYLEGVTGLPIKTWNPLDGLALAPDALAPEFRGQESRLAAAVGVALNVLGAP